MRRALVVAGAAAIAAVAVTVPTNAAATRSASTLCVGGSGCYSTVQAAVDAASDGDTIKINPGTYVGGVTIAKSVSVVGAGAFKTIIKGGGPVVTIFRDVDSAGLTVSIKGLTITGGVNRGGEVNSGGGVEIPTTNVDCPPCNGTGATVTIADSAITNNVVSAPVAIPAGDFCGPLPCAFDSGGGIDNGGVLTLINTRVTGNTAGSAPGFPSLASGIFAGGINSHFLATLTVKRSIVSGNHAVATAPNGQFVDTGGINSTGVMTVEDSIVSDNTAEVTAALSADQNWANAGSGGIHVGECCDAPSTATIRNTIVHGNRVVARNTDPAGVSNAFAGGIDVDGQLVLERSVVSGNSVTSISAGNAIADAGGLEVDGTATIRDSVVAQNSVVAQAAGGAFAFGGGIANIGQLTVERTQVFGNTVSATGPGSQVNGFPSSVRGGGIWNASFFGDGTPTLTLTNTNVVHNSITGPGSFLVQGGGLYTEFPVTKTGGLIAANKPDQCYGC